MPIPFKRRFFFVKIRCTIAELSALKVERLTISHTFAVTFAHIQDSDGNRVMVYLIVPKSRIRSRSRTRSQI